MYKNSFLKEQNPQKAAVQLIAKQENILLRWLPVLRGWCSSQEAKADCRNDEEVGEPPTRVNEDQEEIGKYT